jgi:hypothetical protein
MVDAAVDQQERSEFMRFLNLVATYKELDLPSELCCGRHCVGAKLDSPSSLHRKVTVDPETGSWLIAAGTVIDTQDIAPDGSLSRLLRDYLAQGESVFRRCDGVFALAIYNAVTESVALVSDPFGYFSIFYGSRGGRVFIATSALAVAQQTRSDPSELGILCFLRTGKVFGDMTLWQDVRRMRAATVLEFRHGALRESIYWTPEIDESLSNLSLADSADVSLHRLQCFVERNLRREGKVWTDLTGGFDTRLLAMLLARSGIPFKANFVGAPQHPDVKIARALAQQMGWEYQHFDPPTTWPQESLRYLQEGLGRGDAHLNVFLLLRSLWTHHQENEQFTTLLSGLGGEMWRGLNWWPERGKLGNSTTLHYDRQTWSLMHPVADAIFAEGSSEMVRAELVRQFRSVGDSCPDAPNTVKLDRLWIYRETSHVGAWSSVAAGLVRIIPVLFSKDIVSHVMSLNYRWRARNELVRHMFARYSPALSAIEIEGRGPAAPMSLTNWYRFVPSRLGMLRKGANKLGEITIGRSLWPPRSAREFTSYSRVAWRRAVLRLAEEERLFQPAEMRSGKLYQYDQLRSLLSQAQQEGFAHEEFLGRIITLEMALRSVDSGIN